MRSLITTTVMPLLLISSACASEGVYDELAGESPEDDVANADGKGDTAGDGTFTYYALRGDTRRCQFPACGGHFLEELNRTRTDCADDSAAAACYTPELDFKESGLKQDVQDKLRLAAAEGAMANGVRAVVRGRFSPQGTAGQPGAELGRFIVTEAWVAQAKSSTGGVFVRVADNGLRCIDAPCPSTTERALNSSRRAYVAEIDFAASGLSADAVGELTQKMFSPSGLIIVGERFNVTGPGGKFAARTATNVFTRLENTARSGCFIGGCSGQICSDRPGAISTCEFRREYACYQQATCETQPDGACGWTPTPELNACLLP